MVSWLPKYVYMYLYDAEASCCLLSVCIVGILIYLCSWFADRVSNQQENIAIARKIFLLDDSKTVWFHVLLFNWANDDTFIFMKFEKIGTYMVVHFSFFCTDLLACDNTKYTFIKLILGRLQKCLKII